MKKSQHLIGLPVIELNSGRKLGIVEAVAVNPDRGCVEFLILDRDKWYGGLRAIPCASIFGIGEYAITTEKSTDIFAVCENSELIALLEKTINIINSVAMTKTGKYVGTVTEYMLEEDTCRITRCIVDCEDGKETVVPGDKVITYGSKSLIIDDDCQFSEKVGKPRVKEAKEPLSPEDFFDLSEAFDARQRQFLIGKRAARRMIGDSFQIIIDEGEIITDEVIEKASAMDKYIELTMNVLAEED
ncbi:MAG: hypothetical protein HGA27_03510 [Peptococcaceae bacterium]|nr:hypothetical protein [Peptococcaceae bacterium]